MNETKQDKPQAERARVGQVMKISGKQTISVVIESLVSHPRYGKYMKRRTRLAVHDPENTAGVGDVVEIVPCRRLSKNKSWRLRHVVRRANVS